MLRTLGVPGVNLPDVVVGIGETGGARVPGLIRGRTDEPYPLTDQPPVHRIDVFGRGEPDRDAGFVGPGGSADIGDAAMAVDVINFPRRKGHALTMEVGEALSAPAETKAEHGRIEIHCT